jgi:hypothetical protein
VLDFLCGVRKRQTALPNQASSSTAQRGQGQSISSQVENKGSEIQLYGFPAPLDLTRRKHCCNWKSQLPNPFPPCCTPPRIAPVVFLIASVLRVDRGREIFDLLRRQSFQRLKLASTISRAAPISVIYETVTNTNLKMTCPRWFGENSLATSAAVFCPELTRSMISCCCPSDTRAPPRPVLRDYGDSALLTENYCWGSDTYLPDGTW